MKRYIAPLRQLRRQRLWRVAPSPPPHPQPVEQTTRCASSGRGHRFEMPRRAGQQTSNQLIIIQLIFTGDGMDTHLLQLPERDLQHHSINVLNCPAWPQLMHRLSV